MFTIPFEPIPNDRSQFSVTSDVISSFKLNGMFTNVCPQNYKGLLIQNVVKKISKKRQKFQNGR